MYYNLHYITIYVSFAQAVVQNLNTYKNLKERILGDESSNMPIVSKCKIGYTKYSILYRMFVRPPRMGYALPDEILCPLRGMKYSMPGWAWYMDNVQVDNEES